MLNKKTTGAGRIQYVDACRGVAMFLVVYSHVIGFCYFMPSTSSFSYILNLFFLELFFFISGFVAYKQSFIGGGSIKKSLKKKFIQLLIPSVVFGLVLSLWRGYSIDAVFRVPNVGYWFTVQLFIFYVFYYLTLRVSQKVKYGDMLLLGCALLIYLVSYTHTVFDRTSFGTNLFAYLGMEKWRYYLFFIGGVFARKYIDGFNKVISNQYWMAAFILLFIVRIFMGDEICSVEILKPLRMLVFGGVGTIIAFRFFQKYQDSFQMDKKAGRWLQLIGCRTLDIYMIHYFLLPRNLRVVGTFFSDNINPSVEFVVTTVITLIIIALCLLISNIFRLSPLLSYYLLGQVSAQEKNK